LGCSRAPVASEPLVQGPYELVSIKTAETSAPPPELGSFLFLAPDATLIELKTPPDPAFDFSRASYEVTGDTRAFLETEAGKRPLLLQRASSRPEFSYVAVPAEAPAHLDNYAIVLETKGKRAARWVVNRPSKGKEWVRGDAAPTEEVRLGNAILKARAFRVRRFALQQVPHISVEFQAKPVEPRPNELLMFDEVAVERPVTSNKMRPPITCTVLDMDATRPYGSAESMLFALDYRRVVLSGSMARWQVKGQTLRTTSARHDKWIAVTEEGVRLAIHSKQTDYGPALSIKVLHVPNGVENEVRNGKGTWPRFVVAKPDGSSVVLLPLQPRQSTEFAVAKRISTLSSIRLYERLSVATEPFRLVLKVGEQTPNVRVPFSSNQAYVGSVWYTPTKPLL
jgi:hypothetical protein